MLCYNMCYFLLYNICYGMLYNVLCYTTYVKCYVIQHMLYDITTSVMLYNMSYGMLYNIWYVI